MVPKSGDSGYGKRTIPKSGECGCGGGVAGPPRKVSRGSLSDPPMKWEGKGGSPVSPFVAGLARV